jgi:hypothetical protein
MGFSSVSLYRTRGHRDNHPADNTAARLSQNSRAALKSGGRPVYDHAHDESRPPPGKINDANPFLME